VKSSIESQNIWWKDLIRSWQ